MKYILIENGEGDSLKRMKIFDNVAERAIATREAVLGPPNHDNKLMDCPEIMQLAVEGSVTFDGDHGLEWIDAEVDIVPEVMKDSVRMDWLLKNSCIIVRGIYLTSRKSLDEEVSNE